MRDGHVWAPKNASCNPRDLPSSAVPPAAKNLFPSHCQGENPSAHELAGWRRQDVCPHKPLASDACFDTPLPSRRGDPTADLCRVVIPSCSSPPLCRERRREGAKGKSHFPWTRLTLNCCCLGTASRKKPHPGQTDGEGDAGWSPPPSTDRGCVGTAAAPQTCKPAHPGEG